MSTAGAVNSAKFASTSRYQVDLGIDLGTYYSVSGISISVAPHSRFSQGEKGTNELTDTIPGEVNYGPITISFPMSANSKKIWDWRKLVIDGQTHETGGTRDVTITLLDEAGTAIDHFHLLKAWPCSYSLQAIDIDASATPAIETITLVYAKAYRGDAP